MRLQFWQSNKGGERMKRDFATLRAEMARFDQGVREIARIIKKDQSTVSNKMSGKHEFSIWEGDIITEHFKAMGSKEDLYTLFVNEVRQRKGGGK